MQRSRFVSPHCFETITHGRKMFLNMYIIMDYHEFYWELHTSIMNMMDDTSCSWSGVLLCWDEWWCIIIPWVKTCFLILILVKHGVTRGYPMPLSNPWFKIYYLYLHKPRRKYKNMVHSKTLGLKHVSCSSWFIIFWETMFFFFCGFLTLHRGSGVCLKAKRLNIGITCAMAYLCILCKQHCKELLCMDQWQL